MAAKQARFRMLQATRGGTHETTEDRRDLIKHGSGTPLRTRLQDPQLRLKLSQVGLPQIKALGTPLSGSIIKAFFGLIAVYPPLSLSNFGLEVLKITCQGAPSTSASGCCGSS